MNDEQCPGRGVGLSHTFGDGVRCNECGTVRAAPSLIEWLRAIRTGQSPTVVILSGEVEERKPGDPDFAVLTAEQWHQLEVERVFWEHHGLDREDPCGR